MAGFTDDNTDKGSDENADELEREQLDSTGEFFSVGTPLHAVRAGYIRRAADDLLYEALSAGRYAHVIAPDRSGKSSLVAATAARLENNGNKVAILDLEQIGVREAARDAGRWYYSVAYRLQRQLRIRVDLQDWWQDKSFLSNRQRLLEFYSEVILQNVSERVVIFVDEVQCIGSLSFGDQLLASIRSAHNARATDPEFTRLTFVLLGECDPLSLIEEPELSPFNVTQAITLGDFTREDLNLFITEMNLAPDHAEQALDRIYYWTAGQPYLTQKLARSISREKSLDDVRAQVDRLAMQQLSGRAALHNEPHMSHIYREVVNDRKRREALLNLYGRIRKGVIVPADLGSSAQRRLLATGLIAIDEDGNLAVRNRLYESVFTARWANEKLPNHWRAPLAAALAVVVIVAVPFWYTQLLPRSFVDTLTSETVELGVAESAYVSFRSFPGHRDSADNLYRNFLQARAGIATDTAEIATIARTAEKIPAAAGFADQLRAGFWDRQARLAMRAERRDEALLASLESLLLSTPVRRSRAAALLADDYPLLLASLPVDVNARAVFSPGSMLLTETRAAEVMQWSLGAQGLQRRDSWTITALEVVPLLRRVVVDREGTINRIGLTLNLSHTRVSDLRVKIIAPSGRTIEVDPGVDTASSQQDIRISAGQLRGLLGEQMNGTWTISVRDEAVGVAGHLVGWNLQINSQGLVEDFQRGLNIPDPVERESDNLWFSADGQFAVARAMQSDSARVWDLVFAKPVRAIPVSEQEQLIGLSAAARHLVTATQDSVNIWDTSSGDRVATMAVGAASATSKLIDAGTHLFVQRRSDTDTRFELWSLADARIESRLDIAGSPALVALSARGERIAVADYDRAVRIWDFGSGELLAQIDLAGQPSDIMLSPSGRVLAVLQGGEGASLWRVDRPQQPLVEGRGRGRWQLAFSPSGSNVVIGRAAHGFQVYESASGRRLGPTLGSGSDASVAGLLGFSSDESTIVTGGPQSTLRFWQAPSLLAQESSPAPPGVAAAWLPAPTVLTATPDATMLAVGDQRGDVRIVPVAAGGDNISLDRDSVSYFAHSAPVRILSASADSSRLASIAADNSVRVWRTDSPGPQPFLSTMSGNPVEQVAFSSDGRLLGLLSSNRAHVLDADSGEIVAQFELGERHRSIAFADAARLFVGSESGALRVISADPSGNWSIQTIWTGDTAIRWLQVSPRSRFLVFVDQNNLARQFSLAEGRLGERSLQLPAPVEEVVFAPGGSRVLFRTPRWIHRAGSSTNGLIWLDAMLAPNTMHGGKMVFGDPVASKDAALANRVFVLSANDRSARLVGVDLVHGSGPGLFGNKDELLDEWRQKLGERSIYDTP